MQTRVVTNAILNTQQYLARKEKMKQQENKKPTTGLLSRYNKTEVSEEPLPVKLVQDVRKAFNNV